MIYLINYANKRFKNAQKLNCKTAKKNGRADFICRYNENDIDSVFYEENKDILERKRGNGYWIWKSYFILKTFEKMNDGDYIMYCDSGSYFINDIHLLIDAMEKQNTDIMCFELPHIEKEYSKRDAFILMNCDSKEYTDTKQRLATFAILKKNSNTIKFVSDWLKYAKDKRIITDEDNLCEKENYPEFIENRHDQTIFSLLTKKYNIIPFRDPSQFGNKDSKENSPYPQIIELHRYGFANTIIGIKIYKKILPRIMPIYKKLFK